MVKSSLIDLEHLEKYVGGDQALRDEILTIFEEQADMWVKTLDPKSDDSAWKDAAHALKGAARGVGAWTIGDLCAEAEGLVGSDADLEARNALLDKLRDTVGSTVTEVRRLKALGE